MIGNLVPELETSEDLIEDPTVRKHERYMKTRQTRTQRRNSISPEYAMRLRQCGLGSTIKAFVQEKEN